MTNNQVAVLPPLEYKIGNGRTLVLLTDNHHKLIIRALDADGGNEPNKPDTYLHFEDQNQARVVFASLTTDPQKLPTLDVEAHRIQQPKQHLELGYDLDEDEY